MKIALKLFITCWLIGISLSFGQAPTVTRKLLNTDMVRLPSDSIVNEKGILNTYYYHALKMRNNQNFIDALWWLGDPVVKRSYRIPNALKQMSTPLAFIGLGNMMSLADDTKSTIKTIGVGAGYVVLAGAMRITANKLSARTVRLYNERLWGESLENRNKETFDTVRTRLGFMNRYYYHGMGLYSDKNAKDVLLRFGDKYVRRDYDFSKGMNTVGNIFLGAGIPMMIVPFQIQRKTNYWDPQMRNVVFTGLGFTALAVGSFYMSNRMLDWAVEKYNREVRLRRAISYNFSEGDKKVVAK
ncbi:MAG: hypothetical protein ACKVOU_05185 [Cytophagales bacterium]